MDETVVKLHEKNETGTELLKSSYSYQLNFGLGSSGAKNITFFDRIEQGATIGARRESGGMEKEMDQRIASAWQGTFVSVDTSQAEALGLLPTVYYSTNPKQAFDLKETGWSNVMPANPADVKAIAVYFDTSALEHAVLKPKQTVHLIFHMLAPSDPAFLEKQAVNQYTVSYDSCNTTGEVEESFTQSSAETYLTLLNSVGRFVLQKVDADHPLQTGQDGMSRYAALRGAKIQVYDSDGNPLFQNGGKEVNSLGRLVIENVPQGVYTWEETEAPKGYEKVSGRHPFTIDGFTGTLEIPNHRIPGNVTLTKYDQDNTGSAPLAGAEYAFLDANGQEVPLQKGTEEGTYVYAKNGTENTCETGQDGKIVITGLPWGRYHFTEVKAPKGYQLNKTAIPVTIGKETYDEKTGVVQVLVRAYDEEATASIRLKKKDQVNGDAIRNARFDLYRETDEGIIRIHPDSIQMPPVKLPWTD